MAAAVAECDQCALRFHRGSQRFACFSLVFWLMIRAWGTDIARPTLSLTALRLSPSAGLANPRNIFAVLFCFRFCASPSPPRDPAASSRLASSPHSPGDKPGARCLDGRECVHPGARLRWRRGVEAPRGDQRLCPGQAPTWVSFMPFEKSERLALPVAAGGTTMCSHGPMHRAL